MSLPPPQKPAEAAVSPDARPSAPEAGTVDLRELAGHLARRWRLIAACVAAALLLAFGYLLVAPAGSVLLISHLNHFCRSGPARKRSRIARRKVICAARISAASFLSGSVIPSASGVTTENRAGRRQTRIQHGAALRRDRAGRRKLTNRRTMKTELDSVSIRL